VADPLYLVTGAIWLPVVWMQARMRDLTAAAVAAGKPFPEQFHRLFRWWFAFGFPVFGVAVAVILRRPDRVPLPAPRGRTAIVDRGVATVLRVCHAERVPVVPRGAGTGAALHHRRPNGVLIDVSKPIPPSAEFAAQYATEALPT
jgi:Predicted integral membrane protein (DUF2269)